MKKMIYVLLTLIFSVNIFAKNFDELDKITEKHIADKVMPGSVVLVAKDGNILYHKAIGNAQVLENGEEKIRKMEDNTIFDIASLTKIFATTQAIMKLNSEGKIDLNERVMTYIPEFGKNGKENVKVRDLLTHTSGLTPWLPIFYHAQNSKEVLDYICNLGLEYPTGTARKYSDLSFMMLGFIVEKVSNMKLNDYVFTNIYYPLGLVRTRFLPLEAYSGKDIASTSHGNPFEERMVKDDNFGYKIDEDFDSFRYWRRNTLTGLVNDGNSYYANNGVAGHAGLFSTAYELYVLGEVLLNGGTYNGKTIYSKEVAEEFTKVQSSFGHGYGYEINRGGEKSGYMGMYANENFVGHTGFTGTQVVYDLKNHVQVVILTNKQNFGVNEKTSYRSTWPYGREVMKLVGDKLYK
ncbi:serine hydrolase [Streptobacillus felis]|uniref:serine hydrolase n=1 Tax=Streptobacillus felis TaxID=1384509 RepID=UPI00082B051B|nr:serine hydrolase [Streptobacillus felis]